MEAKRILFLRKFHSVKPFNVEGTILANVVSEIFISSEMKGERDWQRCTSGLIRSAAFNMEFQRSAFAGLQNTVAINLAAEQRHVKVDERETFATAEVSTALMRPAVADKFRPT